MVPKRIPNPFIAGGPVPPERFVGRERDVYAIMSRLVDGLGSSAIYGEARIGKTSLLHYLRSEKAWREWDISPQDFIFIFLDCGGIGDPVDINFWHAVLGELRAEVRSPLVVEILKKRDLREGELILDVQKLFNDLSKLDHRLVILLDEFDNLIKDKNLLNRLRAFVNSQDISLVISTTTPLRDLVGHIDLGGGQTFDRPFRARQLGPFNKKQVNVLIEAALDGTGIQFSSDDYEFIWNVSAGHPFKVQFACAELFEEYLFAD